MISVTGAKCGFQISDCRLSYVATTGAVRAVVWGAFANFQCQYRLLAPIRI